MKALTQKEYLDIVQTEFRLSPLQTRIFDYLLRNFHNSVPTQELVDYVYQNHPDGGPLHATRLVHRNLTEMRKRIKPLGFEIKGKPGGRRPGGGTMTMRWL